MIRTRRPHLVIALTVVLVASVGGGASARILRVYDGETSQGFRISALVDSREGRARLQELALHKIILACDDGSKLRWGVGFGWFPGVPLGGDHRVDVDAASGSEAIHLHGRFWPGHAQGDFALTVAWLTPEEDAMACSSGELTWGMERISPAPKTVLNIDRLDGVTRVRVDEKGHVRVRTRQL